MAALCACALLFVPKTQAQHGLLREIYSNLTDVGIPGLLSNPAYPNNPASVSVISEFEAPDSFGDNYGQRIRGWILPPVSGAYTFWIASDDQGQLFLSSNDRPENRQKIAEVFNYTDPRNYDVEPNQRSTPITLEAGRFYYIEALTVDGGGADHISVRWQLPDGTLEDPIPNERVYVELIPPVILQQPRNVTVDEGNPASFSFQLANRGAVGIQWLRNDVPIPGETNLTLKLPLTTLADNGTRFRVSLTNEFATNVVLSSPVFLTVRRDVTPPTLLAAQTSGENGLLTLSFSESMSLATVTNIANYSISGGVQVLGATLDPSGKTVILRTTALEFGGDYFVTINDVTDRAGQPNPVDPDTQGEFTFGFSPLSSDIVYGRPETPGPSTRRTGLTISEIMYHPSPRGDGRKLKFIEIYNSEAEIVNIGNYRITGSVDFQFPDGVFLPANGYAVVAASPIDVQTLYALPRVYGPYDGDLGDTGSLRLLNDQGAVLLDIHYESSGEWPSAPDGTGPSLVLARPSYGEADPRAWDASQVVGGSPGKAETVGINPYRGLVVNEFLANTDAATDYIELYNYSDQEIDLSGIYITDDITTNKFQIPNGTRIGSLGFLAFDQNKLGFALDSTGERIIVRNPQKTRVIESIKFGAQASGVATGRFPDGSPRFRPLSQPTPGAPNTRPLAATVVINEIMYNPISGNENEEYVELYNRSAAAVNLKGWRLAEGISYTFAQDTILAPGAYLIVARDINLLRTNYAGTLTDANSVGNFNGNLSNSGERISLQRPELSISTNNNQRVTNVLNIVVSSVHYHTSGRWPHWADGGGSSIELIDPNGDTDEASNWADSDETQKSSWVTIERRGILDHGSTNYAVTNPSRNLHVILLDGGEALLDNVVVMRDGGANLLRNPGFEKGLADWAAGGTHEDTTLELGTGRNGGNALHIRATERGDTSSNRIRARLNDGLTNGTIATLRADVRWLRGTPDILLRLHGNYLEARGTMPVPKNLGTPGARNSQAVPNSPPTITGVLHNPILPVANQDVEVSARVDDPDRVAVAGLFYRVDPSTNAFTRVPMVYRGAGYYSGTIPGQTNLSTVAFYIEAFDASGSVGRFPANAPTNTGVVLFGDGKPSGTLGVYRLWLTQTNINRWTTRERSSNKPLDATFVYNNERVIYNMGTLYSGSPFHWTGYSGPLGSSANYLMTFPDDDLFLGQNDFVLNLPSNIGSDGTGIREQTFFWMVDQLNMPFNYRRYHHLFLNGRNRGLNSAGTFRVYEDSQQPNGDFVKQWFPNDSNGDLHKIEDWFEYNDAVNGFFNQDAELIALWTTNVVTGARELKQERYRWWFRKRAVSGSAHDYSELLKLVQAVNDPDPAKFVKETEALIDIDEWMGTIALRHAAGDWDAFGYERGKNMYAYKPQNGKWNLLHWDIAFAFGLGDSPQRDLFYVTHFDGSIDTITKRMMETPVFRRAYYRALDRIANGPLIAARVNAVIDAKFSSLVQNGITVTPADEVKQWIADRREFILAQLANVSAGFAITSDSRTSYSTNRNTLTLSGTAPVTVKTIKVNGLEYPVTWTSETGWELRVALRQGANVVRLDGYDANGQLIADANDTITVTYTGLPEAISGRVVINEINYHPANPDSAFVEIHNSARTTSYDLSGYRLNGLDFTFPGGSVIPPGGFLVVAKDPFAFGEQYGFTIPVIGSYNGTLQNNGEAISLIGKDATGTNDVVVSAVRYSDLAPWPVLADGSGASLQLIDPTQDASRVGNWTAVSGSVTPGATNSTRATLTAFPLLWVNEVQPNNLNGKRDAAGETDPWVELYNSGTTAISLSGLYLTDDFKNLTKWAFPAGANIAAGERIIVWLDGQVNQTSPTELHASFRLDPVTGAIGLVGTQRSQPTVFDYLAYDQVPAGQSYGAFAEGQAVQREIFYQPSPGAANTLSTPPAQVFINEWMANNTHTVQDPSDLHFDDWFELYNAGATAVDLGGYTLTDDLSKPDQFTIPAGTSIPAKGFLLVWADSDKATNGQLHVNFKLAVEGESIALLAPDGSVIDSVTFGQQAADVSSGRTPDGGTVGVLSSATPGASNSGGAVVDPNALQFTSVSVAQGQISLTWNAKPGETYRVEYKENLGDAAWTLLRNVPASGSAGVTTDQVSGGHRFYRLVK